MYDQTDDANIYDEVDEDDYKAIVGKRLERDDFIEDDDGSGYIDNGMDVWDRTRNESDQSSSEDDRDARKGE